jgi:hypothetical protein
MKRKAVKAIARPTHIEVLEPKPEGVNANTNRIEFKRETSRVSGICT